VTSRKITWACYVAWVQGKRIHLVDDGYGCVVFDDGTKANLTVDVSYDGCETCGDGRYANAEITIYE
jgi:hypothetical protein